MLFVFVAGFAQTDDKMKKIKNIDAKVTSVSYAVDSAQELESIDWKQLKSVFDLNDSEEVIEMSFGINYKKSKNKIKSSITISGETKNIDALIKRAKKGVNALIKISNKYQN